MKLLLTSAGVWNESMKKALEEMVGKPTGEMQIAFIPTAGLTEDDQSWIDEDLEMMDEMGLVSRETVDIAKGEISDWLSTIEKADVIWMNGGDQNYLLDTVRKSGLKDELPKLLESRVYVGSSAGSMIVGRSIDVGLVAFPDEQTYKLDDMTGLGFVDMAFIPHLNSEHFPEARDEVAKQFAETVDYPVYALDDESALKIVDGKIEVISEGSYKVYNQ